MRKKRKSMEKKRREGEKEEREVGSGRERERERERERGGGKEQQSTLHILLCRYNNNLRMFLLCLLPWGDRGGWKVSWNVRVIVHEETSEGSRTERNGCSKWKST